jgi:hypothetical protein
MKVTNMHSSKGLPAPNQFHVKLDDGSEYFQSYSSVVARKDRNGNITLDELYWDFSKTTSRYLHTFLGVYSKKEILQKITEGKYKIANLNYPEVRHVY